jgi:oxalate decarboxylase
MSSAGVGSAALASLSLNGQERGDIASAGNDHSASNPGPENKLLLEENSNSNFPPPTDSANLEPVWYSFDLSHKRVQPGGWTNEVTEKVLPSSKDLAGVRMRLTAGSFRELHWHTADEWAIMLYGNARVSCTGILTLPNGSTTSAAGAHDVFTPEGAHTMDFKTNDVGFAPKVAGHYIEHRPYGSVFLEIFAASEFMNISLNNWIRHLPPEMVTSHLNLDADTISKIPSEALDVLPR